MRRMRSATIAIVAFLLLAGLAPQPRSGSYANSLVLAPVYVEYSDVPAEEFARQAQELKNRIPAAPFVKVGFGAFLTPQFPDIPLDRPLTEDDMAGDLAKIDLIVDRARANGLISHIALISGFFHNQNPLRYSAIRQDARNAQWFADGLIAAAAELQDPGVVPLSSWVTPSRHARPLNARIEEGIRILARRMAARMQRDPETLVSISGDGEVEFSFERNFAAAGTRQGNLSEILYTDYSPFMVEEFRDWIRGKRYAADVAPDSDDDGDGHTFDGDFAQSFSSWKLRYFNESGPIPFSRYVELPDKLPASGIYAIAGGFDAPRAEKAGDPFWAAWIEFRKQVIANRVRDFATWMTTSPAPASGFSIPPSRFYTHQIPADVIFGKSDDPRLKTSASYVESAVVYPIASTGITAFNGYDGRKHMKTATPTLFASLFMTSDDWGVLEYNPSVPYSNDIPPSSDESYYTGELRTLWNFHPHLILPVLWSDDPVHKASNIKGSVFERALRQFVQEVGRAPWFSWRASLK